MGHSVPLSFLFNDVSICILIVLLINVIQFGLIFLETKLYDLISRKNNII